MNINTGIRVVALIFVAIGCLELLSLIEIALMRPPAYAAMPIGWQIGRYLRMAALAALPLFGGIVFLRRRHAGRVTLIVYCLTAPALYAWSFAYGYAGFEDPGRNAWIFGFLFGYTASVPFLLFLTWKKTRAMMITAGQAGEGTEKGMARIPEMREKRWLLLDLLALVVVLTLVWFGKGMILGEPSPPPPSPAATPVPKPANGPPVTAPAPDVLIGQVFEATGVAQSIAEMQQRIGVALESFGASLRLRPEQKQLIYSAQREVFPPEALRHRLQQRFRTQFNEAQLRAVLNDFSGPVGRRMSELSAAGEKDDQAFLRFVEQSRIQPPADKRKALLLRLEGAIGAGQWAAEMTLSSTKAMLEAAAASEGKRVMDVEAQMATLRSTLEPRIRESFASRLAYAYREASDDELAAFAAIYESPASKWYADNVREATREYFQGGLERFAGRVGEALASQQRPAVQVVAGPTGPLAAAAPSSEGDARSTGGSARRHARWHLDARACLQYERTADIARCAEKYY